MDLLFELTQVALNHRDVLTHTPTSKEWKRLYYEVEKQSIVGIALFGIERLPNNQRPQINLLLKWIGAGQLIEAHNMLMNARTVELCNMLEEAELPCCILKGQGNCVLYKVRRLDLLRQPGDIDVWINADKDTVYKFVKEKCPHAREIFKHIGFPVFDDVKVDAHFTPLKFYSYKYQQRVQQWIDKEKDEQFTHMVRLVGTDRDICVPTAKFNVVYQLGHMLIHLLDEGVGLRQVIDYYFVLKEYQAESLNGEECHSVSDTIKWLGMDKFAKGVLWIEREMLGLPIDSCLTKPDEKWGKRLLDDIKDGGNFGKYSERYRGRKGFYYRGIVEAWRLFRFIPITPVEAVARLGAKIGTAWRHIVKND